MRTINTIFIHCTASRQTATTNDILNEFRQKGWKSPGYHYLVRPDGKVDSLLDIRKPSNGVAGHNAHSINIAYIGGLSAEGKPADNRTIEQKAAIVHLLLQLRELFPKARIMGHRDIWGAYDPKAWRKQCPCFNATREYGAI